MTVSEPTETCPPGRSTSRENRSRNTCNAVTSAAVVDWSLHSTCSTTASCAVSPGLDSVSAPPGASASSPMTLDWAVRVISAATPAPGSTRNAMGEASPGALTR